MGRFIVTVTLDAEGNVTAVSLPPGIEPWQEQAARCVVRVLTFEPATRDGVAVASQASVPLAFAFEDAAEITYLRMSATADEIEHALQNCYPADSIAMATPQYRVTVNPKGKAIMVKLAESSGDAELDEAGACVLKSIDYEPTKQGKLPVTSTAVIPITLRPPKRAAGKPPPP